MNIAAARKALWAARTREQVAESEGGVGRRVGGDINLSSTTSKRQKIVDNDLDLFMSGATPQLCAGIAPDKTRSSSCFIFSRLAVVELS